MKKNMRFVSCCLIASVVFFAPAFTYKAMADFSCSVPGGKAVGLYPTDNRKNTSILFSSNIENVVKSQGMIHRKYHHNFKVPEKKISDYFINTSGNSMTDNFNLLSKDEMGDGKANIFVRYTGLTAYDKVPTAPISNISTENHILRSGNIFDIVPIPSAIWLLGSGLIGLVGIRRRFNSQSDTQSGNKERDGR